MKHMGYRQPPDGVFTRGAGHSTRLVFPYKFPLPPYVPRCYCVVRFAGTAFVVLDDSGIASELFITIWPTVCIGLDFINRALPRGLIGTRNMKKPARALLAAAMEAADVLRALVLLESNRVAVAAV